jgi:hypothetical protein
MRLLRRALQVDISEVCDEPRGQEAVRKLRSN